MKIKSYSKVLSALAISSLLLAACSNDTEKSSTKREKKGKMSNRSIPLNSRQRRRIRESRLKAAI
ncbi:hypothetical protein RCO48_29315 [Peribacillus frigoritolerans]|nr:hypothetical protein [Peribacillus frigoritolerans]